MVVSKDMIFKGFVEYKWFWYDFTFQNIIKTNRRNITSLSWSKLKSYTILRLHYSYDPHEAVLLHILIFVKQNQVILSDYHRFNAIQQSHKDVIIWKDFPMMTLSNGNIFRVTGPLCGHRWIPAQRPVTRSFDVFFHIRLNKRLSKQSRGWWFETLPRPIWRHSNARYWSFVRGIHRGHRWIPSQRPVTGSFDVCFDLLLNKLWANNRDTADLRRHRAHCDFIVMECMLYEVNVTNKAITSATFPWLNGSKSCNDKTDFSGFSSSFCPHSPNMI